MATVKMNISAIGGQVQTIYSGVVQQDSSGNVVVDVRDAPFILSAGGSYVSVTAGWKDFPTGPLTASVNVYFSSAALTNATLTIAAQPDVPRQVQAIILPGTSAITAGTLTLTYNAADGTVGQVDAISMVTAASTNLTVTASKGVMHLTSMVTTGLVGGASPTIQIGSTATLAVPVGSNSVGLALLGEILDGAGVSTANVGAIATGGLYTPKTAPNGTHTYGVGYSYICPQQ